MTSPNGGARPNGLAGQTSPYLLQHLYNPVDWQPWGPEALQRSRDEDRPIFLSVGYAACHWCHVMERESFENPEIARLLNQGFVPIKVDREERPDIDEIYMNAVQLLTGQGGWPLSVFLTPDLRPFFGGTYFPPEGRYGRIGFADLLGRIRDAWTHQRAEIDGSADTLTQQLQQIAGGVTDDGPAVIPGRAEATRAVAELAGAFDGGRGGFGHAPKFPPDGALALLLREYRSTGAQAPLQMVVTTLDAMALGGIYDHVGGGFARYSVDERWLVPHFEKMLYNQALLVPHYCEAWLATGHPLYARVVEQTLDFVRREMTDASGGLHSSLDADSEGEEGRFYVWTPGQIVEVLGEESGRAYCGTYDVTAGGNFEGRNIPNLLGGSLAEVELADRFEAARLALLAERETRVRPASDDKILTAWNGLMISAFCRAYQVFHREADLLSARAAADFVLESMVADGRLRVSWRAGKSSLNGYLDDYAFLGRGLLDLYESGFELADLEMAATLARSLVDHFEDADRGGFFFTSDDHETLLTRQRSQHDGALPSGSGVAVELLLRLAAHLDDAGFRTSAERALQDAAPAVRRAPAAHMSLLLAAERARTPPPEVGIVGPPGDPASRTLIETVWRSPGMRPVLQAGTPGDDDPRRVLAGRGRADGHPAAWVCRDYSCRQPTSDPAELTTLL